MLQQLLDLLKIGGILLLFISIWIVTIAIVFRDVSRRNLNGFEQFLWLAVVTLLPFIGFLIYGIARLLARLLLTETNPAEDPRLRMTAVRPVADLRPQKLPTMPGQEAVMGTGGAPRAQTNPPMAQSRVPSTAPRFTLVSSEGPYQGSQFILSQFPARIGRGTWALVQLNADQGVSRQHAEIYADVRGALHIRDLNSTHGTFVNGRRVEDARLNPGDRITLGQSTFLLSTNRG